MCGYGGKHGEITAYLHPSWGLGSITTQVMLLLHLILTKHTAARGCGHGIPGLSVGAVVSRDTCSQKTVSFSVSDKLTPHRIIKSVGKHTKPRDSSI